MKWFMILMRHRGAGFLMMMEWHNALAVSSVCVKHPIVESLLNKVSKVVKSSNTCSH